MEDMLANANAILESRKRPKQSCTKRDLLFAMLFLISSVLMSFFGVFGGFALGFTLSYLVLFALIVSYLGKENFQPKLYPLTCGVLSVVASVVFSIYRDSLVNFVLFFSIIGLLSIFVSGCWDMNKYPFESYRFVFGVFETALLNPIRYISDMFGAFKSRAKNRTKGKKSFQIIIGCVIALPIILIVVTNLLKADAAFENVFNTLFGRINSWDGFVNLLYCLPGVLVSPLVFSFAFNVKKRIGKTHVYDKIIDGNQSRRVPPTVVNTVLVILSFCYIVYLFSQLGYFFNAFYGLMPDGYHFTTAEYARRGFFEMTIIVVINLALVGCSGIFTKIETPYMPKLTKSLCTFINAFSMVLIATSFSKMYLYMNLYGLTRKRVLTVVAMTIFALITIFVTIKIYVPKFRYMEYIVIFCTVFGLGVAYADIDTQISRYNYNAYISGKIKDIDVEHMATLSKAVAPYMAKLAGSSNPEVSEFALQYIFYSNLDEPSAIYNYTIVNNKARKVWDSNKVEYTRLRDENEKAKNLDEAVDNGEWTESGPY